MSLRHVFSLTTLLALAACGGPGDVGDECIDDGDCADGLECHVHEEHDHAEGEEHEDEKGVCEEHGDEHSE